MVDSYNCKNLEIMFGGIYPNGHGFPIRLPTSWYDLAPPLLPFTSSLIPLKMGLIWHDPCYMLSNFFGENCRVTVKVPTRDMEKVWALVNSASFSLPIRDYQSFMKKPPNMGVNPKIWVLTPQNHPFVHRVFHDFYHPFWGVLRFFPLFLGWHPYWTSVIFIFSTKRIALHDILIPAKYFHTNPTKEKLQKACWTHRKKWVGNQPHNPL